MPRHSKRDSSIHQFQGILANRGGHEIRILAEDAAENILRCKGAAANLPDDASAGFAIGCIYIATDTGAHYHNTGTAASCGFKLTSAVTTTTTTTTT